MIKCLDYRKHSDARIQQNGYLPSKINTHLQCLPKAVQENLQKYGAAYLELGLLAALCRLVDERLVDVGNDTTSCNGGLD